MGERLMVDFDKTLTAGDESYFTDGTETPDEGMVAWVNEQYRSGATVIIWTSRPWSVAGETAARLTEWGVRHHGLLCEKGSADRYIDDKAYRPSEVTD